MRLPYLILQLFLLLTIITTTASCAPLTPEQQEARYQAQLLAEQQAHLLQQQKASAPFGQRIQCIITNASINNQMSWQQIHPLSMDLLLNHTERFETIPHNPREYTPDIFATFKGNYLDICQYERYNAQDTCLYIPLTINQLEQGLRYNANAPRFMFAQVYCEIPRTQQPPAVRILN